MIRIRRWLVRLLFGVGVLLFVLVTAVLVGSRLGVVRELVRRQALALLAGSTTADVQIGAVSGSLVHTLVVEDLRLRVDGRTVVRVPRLELVYDLFSLLAGELRLVRVSIDGARVRAVRTEGTWRLPK